MYVKRLRTQSPLSQKKDDLVATREEIGKPIKTKCHKNSCNHGNSLKCGRKCRHGAFRVMRIADTLHSANTLSLTDIVHSANTLSLTEILHSANTLCP